MINLEGIDNLDPEVLWILEENRKETLIKIEVENGLYFIFTALCKSCEQESECKCAISRFPHQIIGEYEVHEGFRDFCANCKNGVIFYFDKKDAINRLKAKIYHTDDPLYLTVNLSETVCTS